MLKDKFRLQPWEKTDISSSTSLYDGGCGLVRE